MSNDTNPKKQMKIVVLAILFGALLSVGAYVLHTGRNTASSEENKGTSADHGSAYANEEFGYSLTLFPGWSAERLPTFSNGVSATDGSNVQFTKAGLTIQILAGDNPGDVADAKSYADYLIERNKQQYADAETPYQWEYESVGGFQVGTEQGYAIHKVKSPAGYETVVYVVTDLFIYTILVSELNDEQIRIVSDEIEDSARLLLDSMHFSA